MSNILETFYILFDSKTDGAKKGQEEVKRGNDDLEKGINNTNKSAQALAETFSGIAKTVGELAVGYFTLSTVGGFASSVFRDNVELDKMSKKTGLAVKDLQTFKYAIDAFGYSGADAIGNINAQYDDMVKKGIAGNFKNAFEWITAAQKQAANILQKQGLPQAQAYLRNRGFNDEGSVQFLARPTSQFLADLNSAKERAAADAALGDESRKLATAFDKLEQSLEKIVNTVEKSIIPHLIHPIEVASQLLDGSNPRFNRFTQKVMDLPENVGLSSGFDKGAIDRAIELNKKAQAQLSQADSFPLNSRPTEHLLGADAPGNVSIGSMTVTISTQGTDPTAAADAFQQMLNRVIHGTIMNSTDNVVK